MTADDTLSLAAARLARTAPDAWNQFLQAAVMRHEENQTNLLTSPLDHLPVLQGRAQESARLLRVLAECKSRADKLEAKRK